MPKKIVIYHNKNINTNKSSIFLKGEVGLCGSNWDFFFYLHSKGSFYQKDNSSSVTSVYLDGETTMDFLFTCRRTVSLTNYVLNVSFLV